MIAVIAVNPSTFPRFTPAFPANLQPNPSLKTELFDTIQQHLFITFPTPSLPACHEHLPSPELLALHPGPSSLPCNSPDGRSSAIDDPPAETSLPLRSTRESSTACPRSCPKPTLTECANGKRDCGPDCRTRLEVRGSLIRMPVLQFSIETDDRGFDR